MYENYIEEDWDDKPLTEEEIKELLHYRKDKKRELIPLRMQDVKFNHNTPYKR